MDDTTMRSRRRAIWLAWGAIGGVVVFNLGWLLAGALQGDGYSVASHDVSDLGALTARSPWVMLTAQVIAGTLIIAFALFALGPALAVPGGIPHRSRQPLRHLLPARLPRSRPGLHRRGRRQLLARPSAHRGRSAQRHRHGRGPILPRRPDASGEWLA